MKSNQITEGKVFPSLIKFALPVMFALFLQALYGAVDLWVVGQYAQTADVSGVATGSMLIQTLTMVIMGLSMGITVVVGRKIGANETRDAGKAVGGGIFMFAVITVFLTVFTVLCSDMLSSLMHAPKEAFEETSSYIAVCGAGSVFIIAYNVLGSIFRGIGDSKTPLLAVAIACVFNIIGDIIFVKYMNLGTVGAALATVVSQALSVLISLVIIKRRRLPFEFSFKDIRPHKGIIKTELSLGIPIALQDLLVGISFLVIQAIVNSINVIASAGVGVGEKVCAFIMLVPSAFMQSMAAFVAQNLGAGKPKRTNTALLCGILTSFSFGAVMFYLAFFHGDMLCGIFSSESDVIASGHSYLKAYAIDCLLTPFLFCFSGYYNGYGKTVFVMAQGIIGAFCVRIPVVYLISRIPEASLFHIGLGTPASTVVQIIFCLVMFIVMRRKIKKA